MQKFEDSLKMADITLWLHLQNQEIKPQYYAFRWLTLLLSQEFELPGRLGCNRPLVRCIFQLPADCLFANCQRSLHTEADDR